VKIAVLTGGTSAERTVAIATGAQVVPALRSRGHDVRVIDTVTGLVPAIDEETFLKSDPGRAPPSITELRRLEQSILLQTLEELIADVDVVFLALHGGTGEDGTIQAVLDVLGATYTGSGHLASALAMDKDLSKQIFERAGVPVPAWRMDTPDATDVDPLGWPVIVKPSKQGSTVGLSLVHHASDLAAAYELAGQYDDEIMVEQYVPGRELTVPILGGEALPVGEIRPVHEIFDYECKYVPGMAQEIFPADLSPDETHTLQRFALVAHRALKLGAYSRVDFRMDPGGAIFCLEANTLPGMTRMSLVPQSAAAAGIDFPSLCEHICRLAADATETDDKGPG
jgi:D-alanine-D-alanine ligase